MSSAVSRGLLLSIRFHDARYHGTGDWPPSPARLFQALIAGAASGGSLLDHARDALIWLEGLSPPVIAAPHMRAAGGFSIFVPNNDLDSVDRDPARVGEIRAGKTIKPRLFDAEVPLLYAWTFSDENEAQAQAICAIAEKLYQLGRGVDMAWAWGEVLDGDEMEHRLSSYEGVVYRPGGTDGMLLQCPQRGSLTSLTDRFKKQRQRFSSDGKQVYFSQPSKARFRQVAYNSSPRRLLYELRTLNEKADFKPWRFTEIAKLVEQVRDESVKRLTQALPQLEALIDRVYIGHDATDADKASRLRIIPLPSIGHKHADHAIRRVLIEIPSNCPLNDDDITWSLSGLALSSDSYLTPTEDTKLTYNHYGITGSARLWRTVTPSALPQKAARRRIDPARLRERAEQKDAAERREEEQNATKTVWQALRHAGIDASAQSIRVQREPFEGKGARAESFAPGTRFPKERLWHVEIAFENPVTGPLVIGDGRYTGLGLFAPVQRQTREIFAFALQGVKALPGQEALIARAARRAVMARVQDELGAGKSLQPFFSGHENDGSPLRQGGHKHLFYILDRGGGPARLLILAPHIVEHRDASSWEREHLRDLDKALQGFDRLRAGKAGCFELMPLDAPQDDNPLFGSSRCWTSLTSYKPTRHAKRNKDISQALVTDVLAECARRGLPRPEVEILSCKEGPRGGMQAELQLTFAVNVAGPILLGRDAHEGGGLLICC